MTDDPTASIEGAGPAVDGSTATPDRGPGSADRGQSPSEASTSRDRGTDLVLAGVHLRLGSLALARAELETLAGRDALDAEGILDLAEARWRTGDVEGAGEAAALVLDEEDGPVLALVVAAEAAAARGRPTEARRIAAKALAAANGSIDRIFAGMPRSAAWPPDPAAPPPSPTTMFDPPHVAASAASRPGRRPAARRPPPPPPPEASRPEDELTPVAAPMAEGTMGLWGDEAEEHAPADAALPSAAEALDVGRAALDSGDLVEASIQLALVLRLSSPMAPAVLDLVADRNERELAFVRGDAYRLVGRELDARRAYARAGPPAHPATSSIDVGAPDVGAPDVGAPSEDHPREGDPA